MYHLMKFFISLCVLCGGGINGLMSSNQPVQPKRQPMLFVFGDSYADTGNMKHNAVSWKSPYGITFPGKPSGRYSDGLTATDFLAKVLGAKSPYLYRTQGRKKRLQRGMNFAYGESGVLNSPADPFPNITAQVKLLIDFFLAGRVYNLDDVTSSDVALISYSGNDYLHFIAKNQNIAESKALVEQVVDDIQYYMWSFHGMGFKKMAVTSLQPIGCLPRFTSKSFFQHCNETLSAIVNHHNRLLKQIMAKLDEESRVMNRGQRHFIIDYHNAFMSVLKKKGSSTSFKTPLKPCCEGDCGSVDMKGVKKYTLCDDPKSSFFWDEINPTQEGWRLIYSALGNPLT